MFSTYPSTSFLNILSQHTLSTHPLPTPSLNTPGKVEPNCPELPTIEAGDNWTPTVVPMSSAYAVAGGGKEPKFTNWSKVKEQEDFIDTLDYIFYSENDW